MDGSQFDRFAREIASAQTRRRLLRRLLGGTALAFGVNATDAEAAAVCRSIGTICRKAGDCCSSTCSPRDATGRQKCVCAGGTTACGGTCRGVGQLCETSTCVDYCPAGSSYAGTGFDRLTATCCGAGTPALTGQGTPLCCGASGGQCVRCLEGTFGCSNVPSAGICTCCNPGQICSDGLCTG